MSKLQEIRKALKTKFVERDELVDGMLTALLSREMLFMFGPPGTGKSSICESLCNSIGGEYFSWLTTKFTTPEEIFGPFSIKGLEHDKYERIVQNKLPEADIAFMDEIFKGSSAILNTLLTIINERIYYNGSQPINCPLQTMFAASNELPNGNELGALYDRFSLRFFVDRINNNKNFFKMFDTQNVTIPSITKDELAKEQNDAGKVDFGKNQLENLAKIRYEMSKENIYTSDRKWFKCVNIIKSFAHLNGNKQVTDDDFTILSHVLWHDPKQIKTVKKLVFKIVSPVSEAAMRIYDGVMEIEESISNGQIEAVEAHKKVKTSLNRLSKIVTDNPNNKSLADLHSKCKSVHKKIMLEHLGLDLE